MRCPPTRNELAWRRYEKLIDRLEALMQEALKPEDQECFGQLILSGDDLAEIAEFKDVRRAARVAGAPSRLEDDHPSRRWRG